MPWQAELTAINLEIIHGSLKVQIHNKQLRRNVAKRCEERQAEKACALPRNQNRKKQCDDSMPQVITTSERNQFRVPRHPLNYGMPGTIPNVSYDAQLPSFGSRPGQTRFPAENNRGRASGDDNNARDRLSAVKMPDKRVVRCLSRNVALRPLRLNLTALGQE
ncbi:predicted protein [Histoplasma capsulatum H143]|uniref:Uncharacterized protein n=1 Tax=Ajellomyces capsulatus (strain H143) TaxID=544712 RepID=C6H477_AJECH|nr:predicted protein [Histoplasma capsulatum H143]